MSRDAKAPSSRSSTRQASGLGALTRGAAALALVLVASLGIGASAALAAAPPTLKAWAAGPIAATTADINAQINPGGEATVYWFEWGSADCSANPCTSIPAEHDAFAGAGSEDRYVHRHLSGLSPETTYHFRVVAENDSGTTAGDDRTFTTAAPEPPCANQGMPGADRLPDCRAWEMVSPAEKNGNDVVPHTYKTWAAADGDGAAFVGLGPFAEAKGTSTDVQYVARRTPAAGTSGWSTHAVNPLGRAPTVLAAYLINWSSFHAFSPDLSSGIYKSWGPLTEAPNVAGVSNLYRLRDLDASEPQTQLLSPSAAPLNPNPASDPFTLILLQNRFAGASEDLGHVIFQSPWRLTGDGSFSGSEGGDLYEQVEGAGIRRVGRVPAGAETECDDAVVGSECVDASSVQAGIPVGLIAGTSFYASGMISADGSRVLFQGPAGAPSGPIYMREDGERTYQLNASEKTTPESPGTATVWAMSEDGSRVFFTTGEALVDGDEDGGASDLYMYEVGRPAGSRLTLLSGEATNTGFAHSVVGASAAGDYVYFIADGGLVPEAPPSVGQGLYLWHEGELSYIGQFNDFNAAMINTPATGWEYDTYLTKGSRVTPDGRHLLFSSTLDEGFAGRGGYPGYGPGGPGHRQIYLYSADSGRLVCVSCNPLAAAATGDALTDVSPGASASAPTQHISHALSEDGRRVFFSSPEALVPEDSNDRWDAYSYDVPSASLHLISSGTDDINSYFMDASPDGSDAFFVTREQLLGWDIDDSYDLYDARVGGGFPEPAPVPAPCEGESCKPAPRVAPPIAPTASQAAGPGNRKPRCRKGTRPVKRNGKVRCVKKHKQKPHTRQHRADTNRRAGR